jgi:hypothetical protein
MGTATFLKQVRGHGDGRVYRVDPPMGDPEMGIEPSDCVWVSAVTVPHTGPETYIFTSTEDGEVLDWAELPGSYRGGLDHAEALRRAGYEVTA